MGYRFVRFPEGKTKCVTFSYDDGKESDIRLSKIFSDRGLKGTFNFNTCNIGEEGVLSANEIKEHILAKGHEAALHGEYHLAPGRVSALEGIKDTLNCRLRLEEMLGQIIRGMAYPDTGIRVFENGASAENVKRYLSDLGIAYARTLGGDNNSFLLPSSWLEWMPTAHHSNPHIMEWIDEFTSLDLTNVYNSKRSARLFYIWGHSSEFNNCDNWEHIEEICDRLSCRDDIWYATNIEIHDYVTAYNSLIWSADGRRVYNPTLKAIWFFDSGKEYVIKPDETLSLCAI